MWVACTLAFSQVNERIVSGIRSWLSFVASCSQLFVVIRRSAEEWSNLCSGTLMPTWSTTMGGLGMPPFSSWEAWPHPPKRTWLQQMVATSRSCFCQRFLHVRKVVVFFLFLFFFSSIPQCFLIKDNLICWAFLCLSLSYSINHLEKIV